MPPASSQDEPAHDILAAEAFAVPTADPALHHVKPPEDPSGIPEAHDVLAAEEFAMPAPGLGPSGARSATLRRAGSRTKLGAGLAATAGLLGAVIARTRRRG